MSFFMLYFVAMALCLMNYIQNLILIGNFALQRCLKDLSIPTEESFLYMDSIVNFQIYNRESFFYIK